MYMVEITEDKVSGLSEHIEKALSHMGKAMQCVSELESSAEASERMDMRSGYRNRYEQRPYEDYEGYSNRGYNGSGRYSRY